MAQPKLPIKDILAAIDMGAKNVWDEISDDERKQVSFWLLNRYVSSVAGNREKQELALFKTNEYYNKNYMIVSKHPKLQWQLLCLSGNTGKIEYHPWIGTKKKDNKNSAAGLKLLKEIYPNMKEEEAELLAGISTKQELKELAEGHGIDIKL
jgi:hypothetical protein